MLKDLNECKAEIFRRSDEKIRERRKNRIRMLVLCIPVCMAVLLFTIVKLYPVPHYKFTSQYNGSSANGNSSNSGNSGNSSNSGNAGNSDNAGNSNNSDNSDNSAYEDEYLNGNDNPNENRVPVDFCAVNLMEGITPAKVNAAYNIAARNASVTDFAVRLFKACENKGSNTLISPLSVLTALSMTANGAQNETLKQMESVLGMSVDELNQYIYSYMQKLPEADKYKLRLANSIWFTEDKNFTVNQSFLQTNADYYGAGVYKAPFNQQTCDDINNWVKMNTDEMIQNILNNISPENVMCIINALAFEAEWAEIYDEHQVEAGSFTKEDGTAQGAELMYATENAYIEDEKATGFIKYYKDKKYAFVAMLPKEGISVSEYIASLDGAALNALLENPQHFTVYTSIPKFEMEYSLEMSGALSKMGMVDAFDSNAADFKGIGTLTTGNIYINQVLHKTFISVGEFGTKAGAATVILPPGSAMPVDPKEVYLNRPFVYMLIDCENNIPFFIGTVMDVE